MASKALEYKKFEDLEDDPEPEDKVMPCVSVWYENLGGSYAFYTGGGYYHTIAEAKTKVEQIVVGPVKWT